jgi:hypothetical protein
MVPCTVASGNGRITGTKDTESVTLASGHMGDLGRYLPLSGHISSRVVRKSKTSVTILCDQILFIDYSFQHRPMPILWYHHASQW